MAYLVDSQVDSYISEKLGIIDWKLKFKEDRVNFLNLLVQASGRSLYYENVTWGALPATARNPPTVQDIVHHGLDTPGGACIHLNYFTKLVLDNLGYDAFMVSGASTLLALTKNHPVIIIRFHPSALEPGAEPAEDQLYLVDIGFGRPIPEAIPLNRLPYFGQAGGFKFEFRFNPDKSVYERVLHGGCPIKGKFEECIDEKVDYFFDLKPLQFDDVQDTMRQIFTDPAVSFFLNTVFLFRFTEIKHREDFHYICFRGKFKAEGTARDRKETKFLTYREMLPEILKCFPNLSKDMVQKALLNYDTKS